MASRAYWGHGSKQVLVTYRGQITNLDRIRAVALRKSNAEKYGRPETAANRAIGCKGGAIADDPLSKSETQNTVGIQRKTNNRLLLSAFLRLESDTT